MSHSEPERGRRGCPECGELEGHNINCSQAIKAPFTVEHYEALGTTFTEAERCPRCKGTGFIGKAVDVEGQPRLAKFDPEHYPEDKTQPQRLLEEVIFGGSKVKELPYDWTKEEIMSIGVNDIGTAHIIADAHNTIVAAERKKRNELCAQYEREEMEYKKQLAAELEQLSAVTVALTKADTQLATEREKRERLMKCLQEFVNEYPHVERLLRSLEPPPQHYKD